MSTSTWNISHRLRRRRRRHRFESNGFLCASKALASKWWCAQQISYVPHTKCFRFYHFILFNVCEHIAHQLKTECSSSKCSMIFIRMEAVFMVHLENWCAFVFAFASDAKRTHIFEYKSNERTLKCVGHGRIRFHFECWTLDWAMTSDLNHIFFWQIQQLIIANGGNEYRCICIRQPIL